MKILSVSPFHDASICVLNDGLIEFFSKEERLTGIKKDYHPFLSLEHALKYGPFDYAVIASPDHTDPAIHFWKVLLSKKLNLSFDNIIDLSHEHHLQHASLAFYNSGFKTASVIVVDRNGSVFDNCIRESETIFDCDYNNFKTMYKCFWKYNDVLNDTVNKIRQIFKSASINGEHGIVKIYESATTLIGQHALENGKVMGLSAYGTSEKYEDIKNEDLTHINGKLPNQSIRKKDINNVTKEITKENFKYYADYSYRVQKQTEKMVKNLIKKCLHKNICITGGYGLNVVANARFIKDFPDKNFYFEPLADDTGNSIGGAIFIYRQKTNDTTIHKLKDTFFNFKKEETNFKGEKVTTNDVAKLLKQGKGVAVYNGLSEAGPRALGNRSILFDCRNPKAKDIVNDIKKREWYRPFAASVLEEDASQYFDITVNSPFMTINFDVISKDIPGVTHVDNTCRAQTVNKSIPHFYDLLTEFKNLTGHGILLNTSFNLAGYPLVESLEQAQYVLNNSSLDYIWLPDKGVVIK